LPPANDDLTMVSIGTELSFVVDVLVGAEYSTDSFVTEGSTQIRVTTQII